jgi:hypothetical protein
MESQREENQSIARADGLEQDIEKIVGYLQAGP